MVVLWGWVLDHDPTPHTPHNYKFVTPPTLASPLPIPVLDCKCEYAKKIVSSNFKVPSCLIMVKVHLTVPPKWLTGFVRKVTIDQKSPLSALSRRLLRVRQGWSTQKGYLMISVRWTIVRCPQCGTSPQQS